MSADSTKKTITVALGVCLVCSILVASAAVALKPKQQENMKLDKIKNILAASGMEVKNGDFKSAYNKYFKSAIIEINTGEILPEEKYDAILNVNSFDIASLASNPKYGMNIPANKDLADIKKMPKYMLIYKVVKDGEVDQFIFPMYGKGLWSTMYGFLALDKDLKTVRGLTFYQHGETPGLGGEIDNQRWKESWKGKTAFNDQNEIVIQVIKSIVDPSDPEKNSKIDGLSGATITTRGVDDLVKFWLGKDGYGVYLEKLRKEGVK